MESVLGFIAMCIGIGITLVIVKKDTEREKVRKQAEAKRKYEKELYYRNKIQYYDNLKRDSIISIQTGRKLVKVTTVGGSCEKCKKWESKILIDDIFRNGSKKDGNYPLLSQAVEDGLFHNKCNHWITTYYPELEENKNSNVKIVSRKRNQKLVLLDEETGEVIEIEKD